MTALHRPRRKIVREWPLAADDVAQYGVKIDHLSRWRMVELECGHTRPARRQRSVEGYCDQCRNEAGGGDRPAAAEHGRRIVFVGAGSGGHSRRCYHLTAGCVTLLEPLATFETGPHSAQAAGFKLCTKCAWRDLGRPRPTCRAIAHDALLTKRGSKPRCQLIAGHTLERGHYSAGGGRPALRWGRA